MNEINRTCGGCTACCTTHGVKEIGKPARVACLYCIPGLGCGMYVDRPQGCKTFTCLWLMGIGSDKCRPDKIGVVPISGEVKGVGMVFSLFEYTANALNSAFVENWTVRNLKAGNCVMHIPLSGPNAFYLSRKAEREKRRPDDQAFASFEEEVQVVRYGDSMRKFKVFG